MYSKRGSYTTVPGYVVEKTGKTPDQLNIYKEQYIIQDLNLVAQKIMDTIRSGLPIVCFADFDVDGQGSAANLIDLLTALRANFWVYPPMRSQDGYGINKRFIDQLAGHRGLLITVDNGIAACEEVAYARQLGWDVVILDHHEAHADENGIIQLPNANILIDPTAKPEGCDFTGYCGAGLTYKLAQMLINDQNLLNEMLTITAISTVADVVTLHEDNRQIVQQGLELMNRGITTPGINKIIESLGLQGHLTANDIGFGIAPMLNAISRLETEEPVGFSGTDFAVRTLLCKDEAQAAQMVAKLKAVNDRRKAITKATLDSLSVRDVDNIAFVKVDAPQGIMGILAARVAEQTGRPAFCFAERNGVCTGSARAGETTACLNKMLESVQGYLIKGGGHQKAAGFSFNIENLDSIRDQLNQYPGIVSVKTDQYDLDLVQNQTLDTLIQLDSLEPFGKDFERPVFKVRCNFTEKEFWHAMGKDGNTLRLDLMPGLSAVAFGAKAEFMQRGTPRQLDLIGTPKWNVFNGSKKPQFEVKAIEYH